MDTVNATATSFQFLRPLWLLALTLLPVVYWLLQRHRSDREAWQRAVDPHLLPHLLQLGGGRGTRGAPTLLLAGATLAIGALAGPSWRQETTPLWQVQSPLVIALDLSSAMSAADLPPSRLTQARFKLTELLERRRGGQVGLLVFAGDAFTVAPITRDAHTVQALLDSLSPGLMPIDGQRGDRAINRAVAMLRSAGFVGGDILLLSDHADSSARAAAAKARAAGYRVSALGLGTAAGAPVAGKEGFVTGPDGQVQLARLDSASLSALAADGGGNYATLNQDDSDLRTLDVLDPQGRAQSETAVEASGTDGLTNQHVSVQRSDDGVWLLLLLLPLALIGFRRGWLAVLPLALLGAMSPMTDAMAAPVAATPPSQDAKTAVAPPGWSWDSLWKRDDQRAHQALESGAIDTARSLAHDPALQGAAAYRGDDYTAAAEAWAAVDDADAQYNRGNALAKAEKYEDALAAYDEALKRAPGMPDAVANRKAVEDLLKQQQSQQQKQDGKPQDGQKQDGQKQDGQKQDGQKQDGQKQDSDQPQDSQSQKQGDESSESSPKDDKQESAESDKPQDSNDGGKPNDEQSGSKPEDGKSGDQANDKQQGEQQGGDDGETEKQSDDGKPSDQNKQGGKQDQDSATKDKPAPTAAEAAAEQQAKEAAKREMEQALARGEQAPKDAQPEGEPTQAVAPAETDEQRAESEQEQALQYQLRRVPDDPGGLLRRKFALEYRRRQAEGDDQ